MKLDIKISRFLISIMLLKVVIKLVMKVVGGGDENGGEVIGEIENCENYVGKDGGKID